MAPARSLTGTASVQVLEVLAGDALHRGRGGHPPGTDDHDKLRRLSMVTSQPLAT
ncbi:hypothetical protein E0500_042250 [Streptomyces sp. KM273126]|uniref:hypothetical protein n=1 Tax=Streptomyces sp. KM273126 TaxID=2545247 RepID=UPI001404FB94|nr:hypothetical protein [Streptomyces sp. KM273126]MBA2813762.1 hypothetical protein [Streptomyces sp. KM273126]